MNVGGIVNRLESRISLIKKRHELQNQINALAGQQGDLDALIHKDEESVAEEMKNRGIQLIAYKGSVYKILHLGGMGKPNRIMTEKCLTLSEADIGSMQ